MIKRYVTNKQISDRKLLMVLFLLIYLAFVVAPMTGIFKTDRVAASSQIVGN